MTITALLPNELPEEITDLGANDYLVGQKSGETKLRKLKPSAISPADIGAATLAGSLTQEFSVSLLNFPAESGFRGPWVSAKGGYAWQLSSYYSSYYNTYNINFYADSISFLNQNNSDRIPVTAKKFISDPAESTPNRNNVGFWFSDTAAGVSSNVYGQLDFMVETEAQARIVYNGIITKHCYPAIKETYDSGTDSLYWNDVRGKNAYIQKSDGRLKTNVAPSDLGLDFINSLEPVSYKWIVGQYRTTKENPETPIPEAGQRTHYGLVAQQVAEVLNGKDFAGYCYSAEDDVHSLRYAEFIAPLIRAVQELSARVADLEA